MYGICTCMYRKKIEFMSNLSVAKQSETGLRHKTLGCILLHPITLSLKSTLELLITDPPRSSHAPTICTCIIRSI